MNESASPLSPEPHPSPVELIGYRHAGLVAGFDPSGEVVEIGFSALNEPDIFSVHAVATCRDDLSHTAPDPDHGCGFYSLKDRAQISSGAYHGFVSRPHNVLLEVSLHGDVLEGTKGMRAGAQSVREVGISATCRAGIPGACPNSAVHLLAAPVAVNISPARRWTPLVPACLDHTPLASGRVVSFSDAEDLLGIPLTAGLPLDPSASSFLQGQEGPDVAIGFLASATSFAAGLATLMSISPAIPGLNPLYSWLPAAVAFIALAAIIYVLAGPTQLSSQRLANWAAWLIPVTGGLTAATFSPSTAGALFGGAFWLGCSLLLVSVRLTPLPRRARSLSVNLAIITACLFCLALGPLSISAMAA